MSENNPIQSPEKMNNPKPGPTLDHVEAFEERAAIMEYDGGLSRDRAEAEYIIYGRLRERVDVK